MNARGRPCTAAFSPQGFFVQVPPGRVQAELRACFARWGRPEAVQFDNGNPWGSWGDLPTPLASWLIGVGLRVIWIPAGTPQDNGVVERGQGVAKDWAEPERCGSPEGLQVRLEEEDRVQRECYPHAGFASRMAAYPGLIHSGRPYDAAWEAGSWSWEAVLAHLAGLQVVRRVDCSGKIGLYHDKVYVGAVNRGKEVVVQLDAGEAKWVVSDRGGVELCRRPLTQFDAAGLCRLPIEW
jgi:hypothetical protein